MYNAFLHLHFLSISGVNDLNDSHGTDALVVENTRLSESIPYIEPEEPLIAVKNADNPAIHQ